MTLKLAPEGEVLGSVKGLLPPCCVVGQLLKGKNF